MMNSVIYVMTNYQCWSVSTANNIYVLIVMLMHIPGSLFMIDPYLQRDLNGQFHPIMSWMMVLIYIIQASFIFGFH